VCRNADVVEARDENRMQGNSSGAAIYQPKPDTRARPSSATAEPHLGYRDDRSAAVADSMVTDGDNVPMPVRVTKARRPKDQSGEGANVSMSSTEDLTAPGEGEQAGTEKNVAPKKRRRPKQPARPEEGEALITGGVNVAEPAADSAAVQPSPGEARRLKVHIKAQPGASVRIQNAPPPVAPKPAYRAKPHDTSTETDI